VCHALVARYRQTQYDVGMTGQVFRGAVYDDVRAPLEWALEQRRGECVIHDHPYALAVCRRDEGGEIGNFEQWVGRCLDPQHVGASDRINHCGCLPDINDPERNAVGCFQAAQLRMRSQVHRLRCYHHTTNRDVVKDGRDSGHTGGERERGTTFEGRNSVFQRVPCRVSVSSVPDRPTGVIRRAEHDGRVHWCIRRRRGSPGHDNGRCGGLPRPGVTVESWRHLCRHAQILSGAAVGSGAMDAHMHKPRVAVLFGGRSSEHAISCLTAGSVLQAMDTDAYEVVPVGITRDGRWVLAHQDPAQLAIIDGRLPSVDDAAAEVVLTGRRELVVSGSEQSRSLGLIDVVLPLLHGPYGEDGTVQGLLEMADVRYVGSGVLASALAMDKHYMKLVLASQGLPICRYVVVHPHEWNKDPSAVMDAVAALHWPVFVKPARGGSSIGISKVLGPEGLVAAIEKARDHDPKVLVEECVVAREIECGVLESPDGGSPEVSVPAEIRVAPTREFYDFEAKYLPEENTALDVPASLRSSTASTVQQLAGRAFSALGCEGLARVDFFVRSDGSVLVNEVNTMPGFTPQSMFPRMWAAAGMTYAELINRLLRTALARPTGLR
jgi:D-alanine-D-alanine ligase